LVQSVQSAITLLSHKTRL